MIIFSHYQSRFEDTLEEEYSLQEYLEICKADPTAYATAEERLLMAISEPELVDTAKDPRLSRIYSNRVIKRYKEFSEFYGMEECMNNWCHSLSMQHKASKRRNRYSTCWVLWVAENLQLQKNSNI